MKAAVPAALTTTRIAPVTLMMPRPAISAINATPNANARLARTSIPRFKKDTAGVVVVVEAPIFAGGFVSSLPISYYSFAADQTFADVDEIFV